jgi:sortase B
MKTKTRSLILTITIIMCTVMAVGCRQEDEPAEAATVAKPSSLSVNIPVTNEAVSENEPEPEPPVPLAKYDEVLKINPYVAGWLNIEGSKIDAPVVYTPGSQNYYLRRALDGTDAQMGTLFIAVNWRDENNNTLIYGHNMKDGTAFGSLLKFEDPEYGLNHNIIRFDTLYEEKEYELYGVFYSQVYVEDLETEEDRAEADEAVESGEVDLIGDIGYDDPYRVEKDEDNGRFRFYYYTDLSDEDDFEYFARSVKERALYDTGVTAEWGDEFVTLTTCSYQVKNGRFVVVGVRHKDK